MPLVHVEGLNKFYTARAGRLHVLRDLALDVAEGEMVAVVGASGVGKSTLLHVLGGLDRADSGVVEVGGRRLSDLNDAGLVAFRNRQVGFVFQFHHLLREFSALENVMMPAMIQRMKESDARRRAKDMLEEVGLGHRMDHRPGELSGGEQQRVAIARALVLEPKLLLADEPTGNLDETNATGVLDCLRDAAQRANACALMVTHSRRAAAAADRVLVLAAGRLTPQP